MHDDRRLPVDGRAGSDDPADPPPEVAGPANADPVDLPPVDGTRVAPSVVDGVAAPVHGAGRRTDASPALWWTGQEPPPITGASFSGWTGPEDTAVLETAFGGQQPPRATTGGTTPAGATVRAPAATGSEADSRSGPEQGPGSHADTLDPVPPRDRVPAGGRVAEPAPATGRPAGGDAAATPGPTGSAAPSQRSAPGSGPSIRAVPVRVGDDWADVTLTGPEQAAMAASLFTDEGRHLLRSLLSTEQTVLDPVELDLTAASVANGLRRLALESGPLTAEAANRFYPVPAPPDPLLEGWSDDVRAKFQRYYDDTNSELAARAMAARSGLEAPELSCWLVRRCDGSVRVLPEVFVGANYSVVGDESALDGLDMSEVTDILSLHTHPLVVDVDPPNSYNTTGLSAGDVGFLDRIGSSLPPHVRFGVGSVSLLEGTVAIARRGPVPSGAPGAEDPSGARGPLLVRVLPGSPGSPVSGDAVVQVGDSGTIEWLADAMEADWVGARRYTDVEAAAAGDLADSELTDPPDLFGPGYAPGVVPSEHLASGRPPGRGLVVPPPVSSRDLPLPTGGQALDPETGGEGVAPSTATGPTPAADRGSSPPGGVVVRPEIPGPDPRLDPNAPNSIPQDRPRQSDTASRERPVDPSEFDPNQVPDRVEPVEPHRETFPERDDELDRILAANGTRGLFTFPPLPDEAPAVPTGSAPDTVAPAAEPQPVHRAPLPGGGWGVVVDVQRLSGTGNPRDRIGTLTTVENPRTRQRFVSVQPTRVLNVDGTETLSVPWPGEGSVRVGYNPAGATTAVYRLAPGQTGRVTPHTPVQRITVRTRSAAPLQFNGGGGATAVPGTAYRDPVPGDPTAEEWAIVPASNVNRDSGVRTYSAQVPAGHEGRVDLARGGVIRLRVPAGTRPATVTATEQAFTPSVPMPSPALAAAPRQVPPAPGGATSPRAATPPSRSPSSPAAPAAAAQDRRNGLQRAGDLLQDTVLRPLGEGFDRLQEQSREQLRTTISGTQPLDGVAGFGVTGHRVWFFDGGRGVYYPDGQLRTAENGDPPGRVDSTGLFLRGVGGAAPLPGRAGPGVPSMPPLRLAPR